MNFADLLAKMKALDETIEPTDIQTPKDEDNMEGQTQSNLDTALMGEEGMALAAPGETPVEECGNMPMPSMSAPKQSDSVSMNVSMNGSGAGGIKDLMAILRNIEQSSDNKDADMVIGMEEFANEVKPETHGIQASIPTGDDLSGGKGKPVGPKGVTVGGSNPLEETLLQQLSNLYQEVKSR